ncbi:MAG: septal ring lytic transglycosylase RlpA family protein [Burkholderiales bacterium]|nr:septal ring lytic transglycosylase RlpA family protein [Burkholderiales bacterium]
MRAFGVLSEPRGVLAALAFGLLLAGCASTPKPGTDRPPVARPAPSADRDGPGANPPPDLASVPDAEPRIEPIRPGGANKPYSALGRDYVPITRDSAFSERGLASWYGKKFHGRRTANGETYDMYAMTAAHPTLPLPSYARIRNPANGREVIVRINDRGPFHAGRIVDLSYAAALKLDLLRGVAPVELERLTFDEIRAGNWRRGESDATRLASAAPRAPPAANAAAAPRAPVSVPAADVVPVAALPAEAADDPAPQAVASIAPAPPAAAPLAARGFWVQLGAFREPAGAETFQRRVGAEVEWLAPLLATFGDAALYRVQAGPYPSRDDAQGAAGRVRDALGLVPVIVERR